MADRQIKVAILGDSKGLTGALDSAESRMGGFASKIPALGGLLAGALGVGVVAGLEEIGSNFDSAFDKIRISTGQTGVELQGLQGSFKNVFAGVPASMDTVAEAISGVNQKLGLTGKPLEDLSTQLVNLSRITDTDVGTNVASVTDLFNQFGVSAGDQSGKLDELFRVSQKSGTSVGDLASAMVSSGTQFRAAGLTFDDTAALIGVLNKNGLEAADVIPALGRSMATAAKQGKPAAQVFQDTFDKIRNAPNDTVAAGAALDVFGAKAGPKLAALVREGKLNYEDFMKAVQDGSDTINGAAADTDDWREKLEVFKNKALVALEPVASAVFDGLTRALDFVTTAIEDFSKSDAWESIKAGFATAFGWLADHWPAIQAAIVTGAAYVRDAVVGAFDTIKGWVQQYWPPVRDVVVGVFESIKGWVQDNWATIKDDVLGVFDAIKGGLSSAADWALPQIKGGDGFEKIKAAAQVTVQWFQNTALPALRGVWTWIQDNTAKLVDYVSERWADIRKAVENILKVLAVAVAIAIAPIVFIWQHAHDQIMEIVNIVWQNIQLVITTAIRMIKDVIDVVLGLLSGDWGRAWDALKDLVGAAWDFMIGTVTLGIQAIQAVLEGILAVIAGLWQVAWDGIQTVLSGAWSAMIGAVTTATQTVVQFFTDLPGRLVTAVGDLASLLVQKGADLIIGLLRGLGQKVLDLWAWEASLPGLILGALSDLTKTLFQKGIDLVTGLLDGVIEKAKEVIEWITGLPGQVFDALSGIGNALYERGRQLVQGLIDGIKSKAGDVLVAIGNAIPGGLGDSGTKGAVTPVNPDGTPKHALGGVARAGRFAIFGENGPELGVPAYDTRVFTATQTKGIFSGVGGTSVQQPTTVIINMPPGSDGQDVVDAITKWSRRNGPLPRVVTGAGASL